MRHQRFVLLAFVVGAFFVGAVVESATSSAFLQMAVEDVRLLGPITASTGLSVVSGVVTFVALAKSRSAVKFVGEVVGELFKVTWPTRDEALQASSTVIFTALFVALLIGVYDFVWKNIADFFLFTEG